MGGVEGLTESPHLRLVCFVIPVCPCHTDHVSALRGARGHERGREARPLECVRVVPGANRHALPMHTPFTRAAADHFTRLASCCVCVRGTLGHPAVVVHRRTGRCPPAEFHGVLVRELAPSIGVLGVAGRNGNAQRVHGLPSAPAVAASGQRHMIVGAVERGEVLEVSVSGVIDLPTL